MRFNLRWLFKYVDIDLPLEQILDGLTMAGLEVEEYIDLGWKSERIVVGKVEEIRPHAKTRKLRICRVRASTRPEAEPLQIVCGAPNVKVGGKYPCALPGAVLAGERRIEKTEIQGELSEGMLCSGVELGWNDDAAGLLDLDPELATGEPFDGILEIGVTPNRPDCLSVAGIARDLAAYFRLPFRPLPFRCNEAAETTESIALVTIKDKEGCPRYAARIVRDIQVGPSPAWLARSVEAAGLRSINNVVDATNYVLMELGHPLHAFDLAKIDGNEIVVRRAREGETLITLDGQKRKLTEEDVVIADPGRAIALAGIMGGEDSEISDRTDSVLLESAYFDPIRIRRTRKRLDVQTDSSFRFERGTDRDNVHVALNRAAQLIREVAGGEITKGFIDAVAARVKPQPISLRIDRTNSILGIRMESTKMAECLVRLGCEVLSSTREQFAVLPPSHRVDLTREIDLVEEIARMYGYDRIRSTIPYLPARPTVGSPNREIRRETGLALVAEGLSEVITYSFTDRESIERSRQATDGIVEMLNPLARTQSVLRTSLVTSMLSTVADNHKHANLDLALWEISCSYHRMDGGEEPYKEREQAVFALSGKRPANWDGPSTRWDFYDAKGIVERVFERLGAAPDRIDLARREYYHPGRSAMFQKGDCVLCAFGQIHPEVAEAWDLRGDVFLGEFDLDVLSGMLDRSRRFKAIPQYPAVSRDLAFVVDARLPAAAIEVALRETAGELLESLLLFDLYEGDRLGPGKKSLAYSLTFRSPDRTLTDEEINEIQNRLVSTVAGKYGAELRQG